MITLLVFLISFFISSKNSDVIKTISFLHFLDDCNKCKNEIGSSFYDNIAEEIMQSSKTN